MNYGSLSDCLKCCMCDVRIEYNPLNMCYECIAKGTTLDKFIPEDVQIGTCFTCEKFLNPPSWWISINDREEVMKLCCKLIKSNKRFDIVNANILNYDINSRRFKFEVSIEIDLEELKSTAQSGHKIVKSAITDFIMVSKICPNCTRHAAKDYFNTTVQVRQHAKVKTTFYYLEQMLIKSGAHHNVLNIKKAPGGNVDFFYGCKAHGATLVNFISNRLPVRVEESKKLKGHDMNSNFYDFRYTYLVDIVPLCRNDIVILPKDLAKRWGNFSQLCIVFRVTEVIQLIDPATARVKKVDSKQYFKQPFYPIANFKNFSQFMVMEIERYTQHQVEKQNIATANPLAKKCWPADIHVLPTNDDNQVHVRTHLGNVLKECDIALGVDLRNLNCNNSLFDELAQSNISIPDIILIKKYYDPSLRRRKRQFRLKKLTGVGSDVMSATMSVTSDGELDRQAFLEDLEEDEEMRKHVAMLKKKHEVDVNEMEDDVEEDMPRVPLEELLDNLDLNVNDSEMAE